MDDPETQLAELHARLNQLERHLVHLTTFLLAAIFLVLVVALALTVLAVMS